MDEYKFHFAVIIRIILITTLGATTPVLSQTIVGTGGVNVKDSQRMKAPVAISGENVYVTWWSNKTGNDEVIFRTSTDGGITFGDKINLSNTTNADSTRAEIDSEADSVVVTWWETNQTSDTPVMRISTDNGVTFGPLLKLATNRTIGTPEGEGE